MHKRAQVLYMEVYKGNTQKEQLTSKIKRSINSHKFELDKQLLAATQSLRACRIETSASGWVN